MEIAKCFREKDIPCDTIYLDIDYMDGYRVFTVSDERFSDFKNFTEEMKNKGVKRVTIIDPWVKVDSNYDVYNYIVKNKLVATENNEVYVNSNIVINHYPDSSKSRESYLGLLELSVKEDPKNDRNMHYLGREYMFYKRWNDAIDTLIKHLHLKSATWKDERCASMRFIARCYKNLNRFDEAYMWCDKAIKETPNLRDPYMEKAVIADDLKDYNVVIDCCLNALKIKEKNLYYINEYFNNEVFIYDLLSLAYYYTGNYKQSLKYVDLAIKEDPKNERLLKNKILIEDKI